MGRYSKQFKEDAVKLVTEQHYKPAVAARKLDIPDTTYETWLKKAGWIALVVVCIQGVLGGVTVLLKLPAVTSVGLVSTSVVGSADESDAPDKRGERDHSDSFHVGLIRSEASSLILIRLATPRSERRGAPGTCM